MKRNTKNPKLKIMRREKNTGLRFFEVDSKKRGSFDYRFLIRKGALSHSAFHTKKGFTDWLKERGLKLTKGGKIKGNYQRVSYKGTQKQLDELAKKKRYKPTKVLSNGQYVRGYIKKTKRGNQILFMNPNYKPRVLKYRKRK